MQFSSFKIPVKMKNDKATRILHSIYEPYS